MLSVRVNLEEAYGYLWEQQQNGCDRMRRMLDSNPEAFLGLDEYARAFCAAPRTLVCSDEGCRLTAGCNGVVEPVIGIPGSGILLSESQLETMIRRLCRTVEITTYHTACGANKHYCWAHGLPAEHALDWGERFVRNLNHRLGLSPDRVQKFGFADDDSANFRMVRPADFHPARGIVYDASGCCNVQQLFSGVDTFLVSAVYLDSEAAMMSLDIIAGIALGSGTFRDRFSVDEPLDVTLISNPACPGLFGEKHMTEAAHLLSQKYGDVLKPRIITAPERESTVHWQRIAG